MKKLKNFQGLFGIYAITVEAKNKEEAKTKIRNLSKKSTKNKLRSRWRAI